MRVGILALLCLLATSSALPSAAQDGISYTKTPFGHILSHCVHEVPENSHLTANADGSTSVLTENGAAFDIPACDTKNGTVSMRLRDLPPDYDGWLQYTAVNISKLGLTGGFDAFTNLMSVPDKPKRAADQLFLFPGLQNIDWIPLRDPEVCARTDVCSTADFLSHVVSCRSLNSSTSSSQCSSFHRQASSGLTSGSSRAGMSQSTAAPFIPLACTLTLVTPSCVI